MKEITRKNLIKKENEIREQNTGLANSCKPKPEDTYSHNSYVMKYENTDMYPEE